MTQTVSVGCKLPWGLICEMGTPGEDDYKRIVLHGSNSTDPRNPAARMTKLPVAVAGGYGLTPGVPKDFIEAWMKKHSRLDAVRTGLIFIEAAKDATAHADIYKGLQHGFEPLDPTRAPPGITTVKDDAA